MQIQPISLLRFVLVRMTQKKLLYSANLKIFVVRNDNVQQCTRNTRPVNSGPVRGTRHVNNSSPLFRVQLNDNVFLSFSTKIIISIYCRMAFVGGVKRCFVVHPIQSFPFTFEKKRVSSEHSRSLYIIIILVTIMHIGKN